MHLKNYNTRVLECVFKITKKQCKFHNILYSFILQDINLQYTDHHIVQYIEVQPCLSCTHNGGVPCKHEQPLSAYTAMYTAVSTEHPIHLFRSFSSPSYPGIEAQGLQPTSVPKHDQLGMQLSWRAQSALPLLGVVHRLFDLFWWTVVDELCSLNVHYCKSLIFSIFVP